MLGFLSAGPGGAQTRVAASDNLARGTDEAEGPNGRENDSSNATDSFTQTHSSKGEPPAVEQGKVSGRKRAREEGVQPGRDERSAPVGAQVTSALEQLAEKSERAEAARGDEGLENGVAGRTGETEKSSVEMPPGLRTAENAETAQGGSMEEGAPSSGAEHEGSSPGSSGEAEGPEDIPVSSIVLAAKSRVLRAMLSSEMREGQKDAAIVVKLTRQGA